MKMSWDSIKISSWLRAAIAALCWHGDINNLLDLDQPIKPLSAGGGIKMINRVLAFTIGVALLHTANDLPYV